MSTISYQDWYVGQTYPQWDIPLNTDAGTDNITSVNISSFKMVFRSSANQDIVGTGVFSVKSTNPAEVYYQPSANDVSAPFTGQLFISCLFGSLTAVYDPITFTIKAS